MAVNSNITLFTTSTCKSNKHSYSVVDEVEIIENGITMIVTTYQCNVCWHETSDKREGKLVHVSFFEKLKSFF